MADNLNIKNPSVLPGDLDLRTDSSGNIVSISGHPIAGGGGGGGGTTYYGDNDYIQIKNGTVNTFTVTEKVKDVVDNLTVKIAEQVDAQTYNKSSIDTLLSEKQNELVFAGYENKIETINGSGFIVDLDGYVTTNEYLMDKINFNRKINDLSDSVSSKQDQLIFEYDEDNKVSAINGSALAGQGGTTYTPGQYINIDSNNEISVTGLVAIDEYATYSGDWNDVSNSYKTNSGSFITKDVNDLTNYYPKTQTSSDSQLSTEFAKYATTTYVDGKDPVLIGDSNITATSSTVDGHTQWNLAINAHPTVTDTTLTGKNGIYTHTTTISGEWCVELVQTAYDAINDVQNKLDTTAAAQTYQPIGNYVSSTDISDMATKTWVEQKNYLTQVPSEYVTDTELQTTLESYATNTLVQNTSAAITALIPSTAGLASESDLQIVSAGVDYVSANAITAHQSLTNYYKKDETSGASELSTEFAKYLTTSQYNTDSAKFVTSSNASISAAGEQYALTTTGWAKVQAGTSFTGVTTASPITGDGLNNSLGLDSNYKTAIEQVSGKVDKPTDMTSNKPYCFSGGQWADITQTYYSKTEATGTFLQKNLTNTLSGDGTSNNTLGVNWSNLSGNTIASALSAGSAEYLTNGTNYSGYNDITGAINNKLNTNAIKTSAIGNTTYVTAINTGSNDIPVKDTNFWAVNTTASTTAGNDNWQHYVTTSNTFNYYQMIVHPSGTTADNSWNNDNIIHIILEE